MVQKLSRSSTAAVSDFGYDACRSVVVEDRRWEGGPLVENRCFRN